MLASTLPEVEFKEKVRCGEVYRNLNGNEMFQKFYYRCLECSMDFESSPEFEEHVIAHYLQDDEDCAVVDNIKNNENIINISSDEEENGYLYAFEVASLVEENVSENDLPLPLMQMLSEQSSADSSDQIIQKIRSESDDESEEVFPCEGLQKQAFYQYSEHCCTQCPAYYSTKNELNFHLNIHMLPNTVACPHCYEAFANELKLNEHISLLKRRRLRKIENINKDKLIETDEDSQNSKKAKNHQSEDGISFDTGVATSNTRMEEAGKNEIHSKTNNSPNYKKIFDDQNLLNDKL